MTVENSATTDVGTTSRRFVRNVLWKALLLFVLLNLFFMSVDIVPWLGKVSAYNSIFPGRVRLPFGEVPERAFNLSPFSLEAMFASHELAAGSKAEDEYRVLVIGDSSVWGFLLRPEDTLTGRINSGGYETRDGRRVRAYNLGYPTTCLLKDVMLLDEAMRYDPDMVVWLVTLEAMPVGKQFASALLQHNPDRARDLIERYDLDLDPQDDRLVDLEWWQRTIWGQRRDVADLVRLQMYGVVWAATGVDQDYPEDYALRKSDLEDDESFIQFMPPQDMDEILAMDVLEAGLSVADGLPVMFVNQPIFVSDGENSDVRYNFNYPRWAYDDYLVWFEKQCTEQAWACVDVWDFVEPAEFTNTAFHMTPKGTALLASYLGDAILELAGSP
ncbi:MAG TPA: hypothetical protein G4O08_05500 [Anaerolineae bacterium]|nr:hypothetical protein [Anaerolineae bacterium]